MKSFTKSVGKVLQGTIGAQAIGVLALPIISRLYTPEAFGNFQAFQVTCGFLLVVVSLRYEIAILQSETDSEFHALSGLCLMLCAATSIVVGAVACGLVYSETLNKQHHWIAWWMPLGVFTGGVLQMLSYVQLRFERFGAMSTCKLVQSFSYFGFGILFGYMGVRQFGLILADTTSKAMAIFTYSGIAKLYRYHALWQFNLSSMRDVARKYWQLPAFTVFGSLINGAGGAITTCLLFAKFGSFDAGQYGLVERSIGLPIAVIGSALSQVFTAKLSTSLRDGTGGKDSGIRRLLLNSLLIAIVPSAILFLWGPWLFEFAFGKEWRLAGEFAQIMSPLFLSGFVYFPINMTLLVAGQQRLQLMWEIGRLTVLIGAWFLIYRFELSSKLAIAIHVGVSVMMQMVFIGMADRWTRKQPRALAIG